MASLELRDIRKTYDQTEVIKGVSLSIQDGEFVVFVGPSGCGKSTLLRMMAGLEDISAGEMRIGPRVVNDVPSKDRDIAMVFQNYALYPHMTVAGNMSFALELRGEPKAEIAKRVQKAAEVLGLASLLIDAIAIEPFQHVQEKLAEIWVNLETMRAFRVAAEAGAALDEYGVMRPAWDPLDAARNLYPRLYPRMIEIIQQLGAAGLVAMPTEADVNGPLIEDVKRYFQAARLDALDRIPLFRLAWDTAISAFGTRQVLYERYFFGDPVRMAGALVNSHDRTIYMDKVRQFLARAATDGDLE